MCQNIFDGIDLIKMICEGKTKNTKMPQGCAEKKVKVIKNEILQEFPKGSSCAYIHGHVKIITKEQIRPTGIKEEKKA